MPGADRRVRVAAWNLERKRPTTPRGAEALDVAHRVAADVLVLTEARTTMDPRDGHLLVASEAPRGDRFAPDERTVVAWSAKPWRPADHLDLGPIDRSRIVAGLTDTPIGPLTVLGVCIPWHMAEVTYRVGRRRSPWELHLVYLEQLTELLARCPAPFVVAGDFNQRTPRVKGANRRVAEALATTFAELDIVTAGQLPGCDRPGIDHIACSAGLQAGRVWGWRNDEGGNRLSDHDGAAAELVIS